MNQAKSCYVDHVFNDGRFKIEVFLDRLSLYKLKVADSFFIEVRIQSRHANKTVYYVSKLLENNGKGENALIAHYCTYETFVLIWYFGYANHLNEAMKIPCSKTRSPDWLLFFN